MSGGLGRWAVTAPGGGGLRLEARAARDELVAQSESSSR
jgi:hypothetical protein